MSELERAIRSYWPTMSPSERMFAMMDLGKERGIPSITVDEWLEWIGKPRVNLRQVPTEQVPPKWYLEMNMPSKPPVMFLDEYRIENGKEWHNG